MEEGGSEFQENERCVYLGNEQFFVSIFFFWGMCI